MTDTTVPGSTVGPAGGTSLGRQGASGVLWTTGQKWVVRLGGLATIAVLTRVLSPEDFGVVAAASTVVPLVYLLSDMGFGTYIVQATDPRQRVLSTAFWFSAVAGGVLCSALIVLAPALGALFRLPELVPVLRVMVAGVAFAAVASVPTALLRRRLAFRSLALQSGVAAITGQVVAVSAVLLGAGVWALVAQLVVSQAVTTTLVWVNAGWVPSFQFSSAEFVTMLRFGTQVVSVELVALSRSWAETAIIAASLGATGLGYLLIAQRLVQVTHDLSAAAILPVSTVLFAKVRESATRLRRGYLRALEVSYMAVSPLIIFVAVAAPELIPLIFGPGWTDSVVVAQALSVAGILTLGAMLDHALFYGVGKPGRWLTYAVVVDALTVATTAFAVRWGLDGVAIGFVGVALVATSMRWFLVGRLLHTSPLEVARPFSLMALVALVTGLTGYTALKVSAELPVWISLCLTGLTMLGIHILVCRLLSPRLFADVVNLLPLPGVPRRVRGAD